MPLALIFFLMDALTKEKCDFCWTCKALVTWNKQKVYSDYGENCAFHNQEQRINKRGRVLVFIMRISFTPTWPGYKAQSSRLGTWASDLTLWVPVSSSEWRRWPHLNHRVALRFIKLMCSEWKLFAIVFLNCTYSGLIFWFMMKKGLLLQGKIFSCALSGRLNSGPPNRSTS